MLEAGCGVGAQTIILAKNSPGTQFTSVDVSPASVKMAEAAARQARISNVTFQPANIFKLPFPKASFDHVFMCFVLEHLPEPIRALRCLKGILTRGGTLTLIEGDHGSTFFHPRSEAAWKTIQCLIDLQAQAGGDALIGRRLFPLMRSVGFRNVKVSPRFVYVDSSRPAWVKRFTHNTYIAMVEGVRNRALAAGLIDARAWAEGIADLKASAGSNGVFCYTFFKAVATRG